MIGEVCKNDVIYASGFGYHDGCLVSMVLDGKLNNGLQYDYYDYTLLINSDQPIDNRNFCIKTEAVSPNEEYNNYMTKITISYQLPDKTILCSASAYIDGWNYENLINLTVDDFINKLKNDNMKYQTPKKAIIDYKKYLFSAKEFDHIINVSNNAITRAIEKNEREVNNLNERLMYLTDNQKRLLKKRVLRNNI